jgi:hypothetical protein
VTLDDLEGAALLGTALELVVVNGETRETLRWGRSPRPLLWVQSQRAAVILLGSSPPRWTGEPPPRTRARAAWERWTGEPASDSATIDLPAIRGGWRALGDARLLAYRSDKWTRRPVDYAHEIGQDVKARMRGSQGAGLIVVAGGRFRLTARGLEG